jgi:hypothetical protein
MSKRGAESLCKAQSADTSLFPWRHSSLCFPSVAPNDGHSDKAPVSKAIMIAVSGATILASILNSRHWLHLQLFPQVTRQLQVSFLVTFPNPFDREAQTHAVPHALLPAQPRHKPPLRV